jgi:hypothetical protein
MNLSTRPLLLKKEFNIVSLNSTISKFVIPLSWFVPKVSHISNLQKKCETSEEKTNDEATGMETDKLNKTSLSSQAWMAKLWLC